MISMFRIITVTLTRRNTSTLDYLIIIRVCAHIITKLRQAAFSCFMATADEGRHSDIIIFQTFFFFFSTFLFFILRRTITNIKPRDISKYSLRYLLKIFLEVILEVFSKVSSLSVSRSILEALIIATRLDNS